MDDEDYEMFKIVVIGDSGTGKSNITTRFVKNQYSDSLKPTVGVEFLTKVVKVQGSNVKITFWDTAGQERYKYANHLGRSLSKVYYKGAAGIIIVYDITQAQTYTNVESWMRLANENLNINEVKIIVVGNKVDDATNRQVDFEKAKADYKDRFDIECFETSAKTGFGIQQSIMHLVESTDLLDIGIYAINSKIKGSQMPFDQDFDEEDTGNDMGSVVENNRVSRPAAEEPKQPDSGAFKKAKPSEQQTQKNGKATASSKEHPKDNKSKQPANSGKGKKLSSGSTKSGEKKKGCC